jgi:hypothetical protein
MEYRVTYRVLPPGAGPDDYEPAELEQRETVIDLDDPEPAGFIGNQLISYGPQHHDVEQAIAAQLPDGTRPIILRYDRA